MKYFRYDGTLYTAINPSDVDSLPGIPNSDPVYNLKGRELRHAIWVTERCPELAYMVRSYDSESAFLSRLQVDPRHVSIQRSGNDYFLSQDLRASWARLENTLGSVTEYLLQSASGKPEAKFPFDCFWPMPKECGYQSAHSTPDLARRACARSLDAFRALMARCSMAIALNTPDPDAPIPLWITLLMNANVDDTWLNMFRQSILADFSLGIRVGAYINPSLSERGTKWVQHIPVMVRSQVPVYIAWPEHEMDEIIRTYPFLQEYLPDSQHVIDIPPRHDGWQSSFVKWSLLASASIPPSPSPRGTPAGSIPHGQDQLPGESFEDFCVRRTAINQARARAESQEHRQRRLAREQLLSTYARPTKASRTAIFLWVTVGEVDPTVPDEWFNLDYRKLVGHRAAGELWPMYSDRQKLYNSWDNQWDICARLAPGEEQTEEEEYEDVYDEIERVYCGTPPPNQPSAALTQRPTQSSSVTPQTVAPEPSPDASLSWLAASFRSDLQAYYVDDETGFVPFLAPVSDAVRRHYGLTCAVVDDATIQYEGLTSYALQKATGYLPADVLEGAPLTLCLSAFVKPFLSDEVPPHILWDLSPHNAQFVLSRDYCHPTIEITQVMLNGAKWYCVQYRTQDDQHAWWLLVLKSGVATLELYRAHDIHTRAEAALYLVTRAIPFRTIFAPDRRSHVELRAPVRVVLGWRTLSTRFTVYDYRVYEHRVQDILRPFRARAALLTGGLVWRLALEALGDTFLQHAAKGPSPDVYHYGDRFRPRRGDDWYDDQLSTDELDVICGVYKVVLSEFRRALSHEPY